MAIQNSEALQQLSWADRDELQDELLRKVPPKWARMILIMNSCMVTKENANMHLRNEVARLRVENTDLRTRLESPV